MIDYENPWIYEGRAFLSEDIKDNYGFVYKITNILNGREYIEESISFRKENQKVVNAESLLSLTGRSIIILP